MRLIRLTALLLLACSKTPTTSSSDSTSVGSSAEALRQQRQSDADDVERCRVLVAFCNEENANDTDLARGCERLSDHCDQLDQQLGADRAELEQCLEAAAACEAAATGPEACADQRAACEPADRELQGRRVRTLDCSIRAEQCFDGRGSGPIGDGDAGAGCLDGDEDFFGCCQGGLGRPGQRGDAGVHAGARRPGFGLGPVPGFGPGLGGRFDGNGARAHDAGAGRPGRRF